MNKQTFHFSGFGGTSLPAVIWLPEERPSAVLQITHGMTEHMGRYENLAHTLCPLGIAVAGFDLRGHGQNPGQPGIASFGETGWEASVEDMKCFFDLLNSRFPGIRHYMHGFSLGSFLLREYLGKYPQGIAGALILGTGQQPRWLLRIMKAIVRGQIRKVGFDGYSPLVRKLSFGVYNQHFKPNRTEKDWLCSDEAVLNDFIADPLCRENFSAGLFYQMLGAMEPTAAAESYAGWDKNIPILLICGGKDPVGNMGKGAAAVKDSMEKAGLTVQFHLLPNVRHMVLGEEGSGAAETVRALIAQWIGELI